MTAVHVVTTAGAGEGRGHFARSLAVAESLVAAGATVTMELLRGRPSPAEAARLATLDVLIGEADGSVVAVVDLPDPNEIRKRWPSGWWSSTTGSGSAARRRS